MPRKKKKEEILVHLDLEKMSKPVRRKKEEVSEDVVSSETVGGILKQARQQKKLKLSQIAKTLCIKEVYLDALAELQA
jgi:ribosome-binding protein aMBF1 (putative translation factor)